MFVLAGSVFSVMIFLVAVGELGAKAHSGFKFAQTFFGEINRVWVLLAALKKQTIDLKKINQYD